MKHYMNGALPQIGDVIVHVVPAPETFATGTATFGIVQAVPLDGYTGEIAYLAFAEVVDDAASRRMRATKMENRNADAGSCALLMPAGVRTLVPALRVSAPSLPASYEPPAAAVDVALRVFHGEGNRYAGVPGWLPGASDMKAALRAAASIMFGARWAAADKKMR